jgi:hypothetical protein
MSKQRKELQKLQVPDSNMPTWQRALLHMYSFVALVLQFDFGYVRFHESNASFYER